MHSTVTKTVSAPIETVWALVSDHEGMTGWAPGLTARLTTPGAPDRNGVGAVRRLSTRLPMPAIVEEIVGFEPGRRLAYRALSGVPMKEYAGEVVLTPAGSGTEISYTISAKQRLPLVDRALTRVIASSLLAAVVRQAGKRG